MACRGHRKKRNFHWASPKKNNKAGGTESKGMTFGRIDNDWVRWRWMEDFNQL